MAYASCHCTLLIFLLIAGLCNARTGYNTHDLEMGRRHELWMAEYGRVYKDAAEKAVRFEIFKQNVKYIEDFNNAREHNYTLGVNLFADLTNEEYRATYASGLKIPDGEFEESLRSIKYETMEDEALNYTAIPTSVDWRAMGAVTSVKFQVKCSGCWAFAAAATIESLHKIKKGVLYDLSVQQIIDCTGHNCDCTGGHVFKAYEYIIRNGGLTTWTTYPYNDKDNICDATKGKQTVASIKGYGRVRGGEPQLRATVAMQPVAVAVEAKGHDFQFYKGGVIFSGSCSTSVDHAVVVVGYGEEGGEKYWIVKNSYSDKWGEAGYIRMKRDVGTREGLCGILLWPYYPSM